LRAGLWRSWPGLASDIWPVVAGILFLLIPILRSDLFRARRAARNGISIAKPLREVAVATALAAEGAKRLFTRFFADWAGFGCGSAHDALICACGLSSASPGSVSISTCLPLRRPNSSIHSGLSLALSAGWTLSNRTGPTPWACSATRRA